MKRRRVALALLAVLLLLAAVKERFDPHLVLYLDDLLRPKPAPLTVPPSGELALRLYADTRPHIGKIASLQKGLVLVYRGKEVAEESFGFGAPIIQAGGVPYLSRHATTSLVREAGAVTLVKTFAIDTADRPTRFWRVKYEDVPSLGVVTFRYTLRGSEIEIAVDLSGLQVDWEQAYLMNEQGAINFQVYQDADGRLRHGDELGIWHATEDAFGCWVHRDGALRFCVQTEPGRPKYVGRERYNQYRWTGIFYLSWSGIDLELDPPLEQYRYVVRVEAIP